MTSQLKVWGLNLFLSGVVALSFCLYAMTFRRVRGMPMESASDAFNFAWSILTDRYFILGLILALGGSILRIALMRWLDISRTALASEVNLVMTLVLTYLLFGSKLRFPEDYMGAALILLGSFIVAK